jgi:alkylhydroperoxidase family enzyme
MARTPPTPRLSPVPKAEWPEEIATFIAGYRNSVRGDRPEDGRQSGANLLGTLVRYPALAKAFLTFNGHFLYSSTLSARQRELLILRVAFLRRCDYEWAQHAILAEKFDIRPDEVTWVAVGPDAAGWSPAEAALLKAADELVVDGAVSGETWAVLRQELDERQLMDVVFTVGTYETVAMALSSFGVEPEADLIPFIPKDLANGR